MRRRAAIAVLAAGALLIAAGAVAWSLRVPLLAWAAVRLLERQGLGPVALTVDAAGPHEFSAHGVALRGGALRARIVTASYSLAGLAAAHLDRVEIDGLDATLALGKDGVELGGAPLPGAGGGGSTSAPLRVDALLLPDAHVTLDTAMGPVAATVSTTLALTEDGIRAAPVAATIAAPITGARRTARIEAQRASLEPRAQGGVALRVAQAAVTPEDLPWTAQGIDGEMIWAPEAATAHLAIARLVDRQQPPLLAPLGLAADATLAGPRVNFTLRATAGPKDAARLDAKGQYDLASDTGSASLALGPIVFRRGSLQPADIAPAIGGLVADTEGSVAVTGSLRWRGGVLSPDVTVRPKDLAFAAAGVRIRGLAGAIEFVGLRPPATAPGQSLSATVEVPGLPPAAVALTGRLLAKPALELNRITAGIAGGTIAASPMVIDPAAPNLATTLAVDGVDLARIMKLLSIDGLSGTGVLDGRIPLGVADDKVTVSAGRLAARGPGVVRYRPAKLPAAMAAAGDQVELMLQALGDFHYDRLALDLDKSAGGEGAVLLRLEGSNPAVRGGQPFVFNIRIESNFDRLAEYAALGLSSAQELLRRAARRAGH